MGFGHNPRFRISQRQLDFDRARTIWNDKDLWHRNTEGANISDQRPGASNYWIHRDWERNPITGESMECYHFLMYRTNIHTWFSDGTYKSIYYDTGVTRDMLSNFGPVPVWNASQCVYHEKARFARRYRHEPSYPYGGGLVIDPAGNVVGPLIDYKDVMRPDAKKQRSKIRNEFRDRVVSRILLGEFDANTFATYKENVDKGFNRTQTGWMPRIPVVGSGVQVKFYEGAPHAEIEEAIKRCWSWVDGPARETENQALALCVDLMADVLLDSASMNWTEKVGIPYERVNINED